MSQIIFYGVRSLCSTWWQRVAYSHVADMFATIVATVGSQSGESHIHVNVRQINSKYNRY